MTFQKENKSAAKDPTFSILATTGYHSYCIQGLANATKEEAGVFRLLKASWVYNTSKISFSACRLSSLLQAIVFFFLKWAWKVTVKGNGQYAKNQVTI